MKPKALRKTIVNEVKKALEYTKGNKVKAAELLKVSTRTIRNYVKANNELRKFKTTTKKPAKV